MALEIAIAVVGGLLAICGLVSLVVSIWLAVKYVKYNRRKNSAGLTGQQVARQILDENGLGHIGVKATGSILFGNSYSHYFKKVRLRRFTRHETSLTSLGMGAQKAALALLDKEGDPDMRKRVRLVPLITFGPFAFVPLLAIGALIDYFVFNATGYCTLVLGILGFLFFGYSIVLSVMTLKTERKAQDRAYAILAEKQLITAEELADLRSLFHLYNIQYVNDIILAALELIYLALEIAAAANGNSVKS